MKIAFMIPKMIIELLRKGKIRTYSMLNNFYFSDLFLDGKEITPYFMPRFVLSGRKNSAPLNYPFIYSCNITEQGIELHSLPYPRIGCDISYQDIKWVEMFVIRRLWGLHGPRSLRLTSI